MAESQTTARRQIMIFAMGAMTLITLATTLIVGAHYWEMLSGVFLIALVGLALPDWAAWWATYWHARATKQGEEDTRVAVTCLVVSLLLSVVMIANAGAVMAVWWDDKHKTETEDRSSKAATDLQASRNTGNTDAIKARGLVVQQMKAAGATERTVREYLKAEADRDKTKALTSGGETPTAKAEAYASAVPDTVRNYMAFWVYIIPFLAGLFGVAAIIISVALPGGVSLWRKPERQQPQSTGFAQGVPATATKTDNSNFYDPNAGK